MRIKKTHCKRGHERTPENLTKHGSCRTCRADFRQTPEYKAYQKAYKKAYREALPDRLIAYMMQMPLDEIPPAVLDMKRTLILLKREIKKRKI